MLAATRFQIFSIVPRLVSLAGKVIKKRLQADFFCAELNLRVQSAFILGLASKFPAYSLFKIRKGNFKRLMLRDCGILRGYPACR